MARTKPKTTKARAARATAAPATEPEDVAVDDVSADLPIETDSSVRTISSKAYRKELATLQVELVRLQEWVRARGLKVVILFEGRDAAGKGGAIKTITLGLNPRIARVVALPAPTDRERSQWYFQRYVAHLPAAGELVLFDRSWYNRAGVERVMGFCTEEDARRFLELAPAVEKAMVDDRILLVKYWLEVTTSQLVIS